MPAPKDFTWPNGSKLAVSVVVNVEEGAEHNIRDGDKGPEPVDELGAAPRKPIRLHGSESNYQYGIKAGAPRVLRLLKDYGVTATFTAASLALERAQWLADAIVADGHEVCCHGYRWVPQHNMDEATERDFITKGRDSIAKTCGKPPAGWLSRYLHTDETRRLLAEAGFTYTMDDYSDDFPFWETVSLGDGSTKPMVVVPYAIDTNDMKMWNAPALQPWDWARYAIDTIDWLHKETEADGAKIMSLGLHLRIIGRPGRIGAFEQVLKHASEKGHVWLATRGQIAEAFAEAVPYEASAAA